MKTIEMQVKFKKYKIEMASDIYNAFLYMKDIKVLKRRVRYAILNNESNNNYGYICRYDFISSALKNPSYDLIRIDNNTFEVVELSG